VKSPLTLDTILDTLDTLDRDGIDLSLALQNALVPEVIS
jgi:hypothetical protein